MRVLEVEHTVITMVYLRNKGVPRASAQANYQSSLNIKTSLIGAKKELSLSSVNLNIRTTLSAVVTAHL